mgnify:CR=1 FL=1
MEGTLDVLDTQLLVYMANEAEPWAVDFHEEILRGECIVFLPRYVATEFYQVMERNRGEEGAKPRTPSYLSATVSAMLDYYV